MKVMYKLLSLFFILAAFAVLGAHNARADSINYDFVRIEVNDLEAFQQGSTASISNLNVELLDKLTVEITLQASANISGGFVDDVVCEANIFGYEFGALSGRTPIFTIEQGLVYKKTVTMDVPDDIDASETYTLRVECSDPIDEEQHDFTLFINEIRHYLRIFDIVTSPSNTISAGQPLITRVRLENRGQKQEEDIKVTISIPELGISESNFIDELVTLEQEEREQFLFEEEAQGQIDLLLRIPQDTPTGQYTLQADVVYNRGTKSLSEKRTIFVQGVEKEKDVETILNIDTTTKQAAVGEAVTYTITIANLGTEKGVYSVSLDGLGTSLEGRVEPGFLTVLPDSTGQVTISVTPTRDAEMRDYAFVANVLLGTEVINQINLRTKVTGVDNEAAEASGSTAKTVLGVVFVILVIVLVVLGLVIAFRRDNGDEESSSDAGAGAQAQTYYTYYQPRN